jgi:hypothetical protein
VRVTGPTHDISASEDRLPQTASTFALVEKMRSELAEVDLECHCRETLDSLLEKLRESSWRQERAQALGDARAMRERIAGFLGFLAELDDLTPEEEDLTCFQELAATFEDIGAAARMGAEAARRVAAIDAAWQENIERHRGMRRPQPKPAP